MWAEFAAACFAHKTPPPGRAFFEAKRARDPFAGKGTDEDVRAVRGDGRFRCALRLVRGRRVVGAPRDCTWVGLAEVCTAPEDRGKGLALNLVRATVDEEDDQVVFFLHASDPKARALYARCGFVPCPRIVFREMLAVGSEDDVNQFASSLCVTELDPVRDDDPAEYAALARVYASMPIPGTLDRAEVAYWHQYVRWKWSLRSGGRCIRVLGGESAANLIGYAFVYEWNGFLRVDELAFNFGVGETSIADAVLNQIMTHARVVAFPQGPNRFTISEGLFEAVGLSSSSHWTVSKDSVIFEDVGWMQLHGGEHGVFACAKGVFFDADGF